MNRVRFYLDIPADRYLAFYQGVAREVVVRAHNGQRIQFPAERLRPFVGHDGVRGEFELLFDTNRRFRQMVKVGELPPDRSGG